MKISEVMHLQEGVAIHDGPHFLAYVITVAEAYDAAPVSQPEFAHSWQTLVKHNAEVMFSQIKGSGVTVEFCANDPYDISDGDPSMAIRLMLWDMIVNKRLKIFTGYSDSHPVFSELENVIFRTVHDYYTHGKLRATFAAEIKRLGLDKHRPSGEELMKALPNVRLDSGGNLGHRFNMRGEMNSFSTHAKLAPRAAQPALFTEIVGQVSYQCVVGNFPVQKAAVLPGFDYARIGVASGQAGRHMAELLEQLKAGATSVQSSISAAPQINIAEVSKRLG